MSQGTVVSKESAAAPAAVASTGEIASKSSSSSGCHGRTQPSSSLSTLSATLAMTPHDADRMAEASRALHACLKRVPIPPPNDSNNKDKDPGSSRLKPASMNSANKVDSESNDNSAITTAAKEFLDSNQAIHKLMDRPGGTLTLHQMLLEATQQCQHSMIESFVARMEASGLTAAEAKAGLIIFQEMDKSSKLKLVFGILAATTNSSNTTTSDGDKSKGENQPPPQEKEKQPEHDHKENAGPNNNSEATGSETPYATPSKGTPHTPAPTAPQTLNQEGALSMFQTILTAICCCVHSNDDDIALKPVVTQDEEISTKDSFQNPPKEMTKMGEDSDKKKEKGDRDVKVSTAPDSNIGLSKQLQSEIKTTASDAARSLIDFALYKTAPSKKPVPVPVASLDNQDKQQEDVMITFDVFGDWYNTGGCQIASWLELLHLNKWNISSAAASAVVPPTSSLSVASHQKSHLSRKLSPKPSGYRSRGHVESLSNLLRDDEDSMQRTSSRPRQHHLSRSVVTFDFTSSSEGGVAKTAHPMCIDVVEESVWVLRSLVYGSGLIYRTAADVCKTVMRMSHKRLWDGRPLVTLRRDDFRHLIGTLITPPPPGSATKTPQKHVSSTDIENFGMILEDFFACFEGNFHQSTTAYHPLSHDEVNAKELAVGFCFLCAGNKSTKLATGFELLDDARSGFLNQQQLMRFLRSHLTMMVATSLLRENHARKRQPLSHTRKEEMRAAVENGAHWTLRHFLKTVREKHPKSYERDAYSFEVFAEWYSKGGYAVAPWLELLDLNKLVSLLGDSETFAAMPQGGSQSGQPTSKPSVRERRSSHRRQSHNRATAPPAEVLFTFPLANQRSLIVLREDAVYVRGVVEQLGALSLSADSIWNILIGEVNLRPELCGPSSEAMSKKNEPEKNTLLDVKTFLQMMEVVLQSVGGAGRKRSAEGNSKLSSSNQELLTNFFHSYDLDHTKMVAMNELMGGLTLLCGGKKSAKLAFSFGVFDGRPQPKAKKAKSKQTPLKNQSLDAHELYLFLRSFLIILFSCCCQTLDMSDSSVDRYIEDTAHMVADDVMRYQWHTRKVDRVDFDEFGEWYNEGGFEIAPWLELLDLKKWVLVDNFDVLDTKAPAPTSAPLPAATVVEPPKLSPKFSPKQSLQSPTCPPPPPEDVLDPSFFENDDDIMHMDSIDEMDIMLMPSHDKEGELLPVSRFTYSPSQSHHVQEQPAVDDAQKQALKFHLLSEDDSGGFMLSISQKRISHFRQIMLDSGLYNISTESACASILKHASGTSKTKTRRTITRKGFDAAVRDILDIKDQGGENHKCLLDVLSFIFKAFDVDGKGKPGALQVACGMTVLCHGKKSDKLEYAFEVLDKDKKGELSKDDMHIYMRSFLTVLLGIACTPALETDELEDTLKTGNGEEPCERNIDSLVRAVDAGSDWAVAQAFKRRDDVESISFDDFAGWYTDEGHISIPWIELLALRKWLIV